MKDDPALAVVIPVKDRADELRRCLLSVTRAIRADLGDVLVLADNGSGEEAVRVMREVAPAAIRIVSRARRIGGVRNDGAAAAPAGRELVFLDSDCEVRPSFLDDVRSVWRDVAAAAVGCEVVAPTNGHWTERTWDAIHRPEGDGPRHYINSACFCVRRAAFAAVGGFDPERESSEDVDISWRLRKAGHELWQSERLRVIHLGNPKTLAGVYRRVRWHGRGVWQPGGDFQLSRMTVATLLHGAMGLTGLVVSTVVLPSSVALAVTAGAGSLLFTPVAFVLARAVQFRRRVPVVRGAALMLITFTARLHGLADALLTVAGRLGGRRKPGNHAG